MPRFQLPDPEEMAGDGGEFDDRGSEFEEEDRPLPTRTDRLPPPVEIGGSPGYSEIHGSRASIIGGRATSPRLFTSAAGHATAAQLRVWKVENGVAVALGAIDSTATEEDLVRMFRSAMPKPGEGRALYKIRPIDTEGREMGVEAPIYISEHHAALQSLRAQEAAGSLPPVAPVRPVVDDGMTRMFQDFFAHMQDALREERKRNHEVMTRTAEDRIALATSGVAAQQAMAQQLLDVDARRSQTVIEQMQTSSKQQNDAAAAFFTMQMQAQAQQAVQAQQQAAQQTSALFAMMQSAQQAQAAQAAQALADAEARAQRAREDDERRWRREREEQEQRRRDEETRAAERDRERTRALDEERRRQEARVKEEERRADERARREAAEAAAKDAERQRAHEMAMRALELERARDKEHAERMAELQRAQYAALAASTSTGGIKTLIAEATGLLTAVGVDPASLVESVIERFRAPADDGASSAEVWADLAGKVLGTVGEVAKAKLIADAQAKAPRPRVLVPPGMRPGPGYAPPGYPGAPQAPGYPLAALPGPVEGDLDDDDLEDDDEEPTPRRRAPAPVPARAAQPVQPAQAAPQPAQATVPGGGRLVAGSAPGVVRLVPPPPPAEPAAQAAPVAAAPAAAPAAPAAAAAPAPAPAPAAGGLSLVEQRNARGGLRKLAAQLRSSKAETWQGAIILALTQEPAIFRYIQARTVRAAVLEAADGDAAFTERVIAALRESPLVPDDLNYG